MITEIAEHTVEPYYDILLENERHYRTVRE